MADREHCCSQAGLIRVWHPLDLPNGLPHGSPGAEPDDARTRFRRGLPPGCRAVGRAPGRRDATQPQRARSSVIPPPQEPRRGRHLIKNQMFVSRQTAGQRPRPKSLLIYISWYINGYGRPWTSSDVNPRISPVHGQIAGFYGGCMRLRIKWPAATFPRAAARTTGTGQMPFWSGVHAAVDGPFTILRFAERDTPDLVYFEQLTCVLYLDKNEASSITSW